MGYNYNECAGCRNRLSIERAVLHCGSCEKPIKEEVPTEWEPMSEADRNNERCGEYIRRDAAKEILRDELEATVRDMVDRYDTEKCTAQDAMKRISHVFCFYSGALRRMKESGGGAK